ncbi:cytidylyltransferase domain-containing protein [Mycolicibacterium sp. F2034L]|uniref:acylneuraminate cytidylyltransferase family protein n=1 Tax=Mycolicibacterium sp. F2034L TaxID=2926422 RepID=UPI001FF5F648|nr:acylneuraminate cytidylyltransferase family protein [Mycolicibacterium sp. F2034L]MCK0177109.1 acylneuraminate cytidylyltransferase family protein [Mycolicibacterium sp. F2034L]
MGPWIIRREQATGLSEVKVAALVAARGGSERVVGKNTKTFADSTLLDIKLAQLRRLRSIDEVVVSSDDDKILNVGRGYGCTVRRRPDHLATSTAPMSNVYRYMAEEIEADIIVYANCTSPLVRDSTVEALIESFISLNSDHDSINTASVVREFLVLDGTPINYDPYNQPRSQDLPDIAALNFAVNVIRRETMIARSNVLGNAPCIHTLDQVEGMDIDTRVDFDVAEFLYQSLGGENYLRQP